MMITTTVATAASLASQMMAETKTKTNRKKQKKKRRINVKYLISRLMLREFMTKPTFSASLISVCCTRVNLPLAPSNSPLHPYAGRHPILRIHIVFICSCVELLTFCFSSSSSSFFVWPDVPYKNTGIKLEEIRKGHFVWCTFVCECYVCLFVPSLSHSPASLLLAD